MAERASVIFRSSLLLKIRLFRPKNKNTESTYLFRPKIKCRKIKKSQFSVLKMKFGRPLVLMSQQVTDINNRTQLISSTNLAAAHPGSATVSEVVSGVQ